VKELMRPRTVVRLFPLVAQPKESLRHIFILLPASRFGW